MRCEHRATDSVGATLTCSAAGTVVVEHEDDFGWESYCAAHAPLHAAEGITVPVVSTIDEVAL